MVLIIVLGILTSRVPGEVRPPATSGRLTCLARRSSKRRATMCALSRAAGASTAPTSAARCFNLPRRPEVPQSTPSCTQELTSQGVRQRTWSSGSYLGTSRPEDLPASPGDRRSAARGDVRALTRCTSSCESPVRREVLQLPASSLGMSIYAFACAVPIKNSHLRTHLAARSAAPYRRTDGRAGALCSNLFRLAVREASREVAGTVRASARGIPL